MKKLSILLTAWIVGASIYSHATRPGQTGAPPNGLAESEFPQSVDPYAWIREWQRPESPPKVGIQVGHWQYQDAPEEQKGLRDNAGASAAGTDEVDINMAIALELQALLENQGIEVDVLPVTIPPGYWADVFITIHADGSEDTSKSGFKFARPWRDFTGRGDKLVAYLETAYEEATGMTKDDNITRNMRGYYAFAWWRYSHAIHPMTPAVIAETGFVTNPSDRSFLTNKPEVPAGAIASAITTYLSEEHLL